MSLITDTMIQQFENLGINKENGHQRIQIIDATDQDGNFLLGVGTGEEAQYLWIFTNKADLNIYETNPEIYFPEPKEEV